MSSQIPNPTRNRYLMFLFFPLRSDVHTGCALPAAIEPTPCSLPARTAGEEDNSFSPSGASSRPATTP
jgi:hypothetical protein